MQNKISEGNTIDFTVVDNNVKSGEIVVINDIVGVAMCGGGVGETIAVSTRGVYSLAKSSEAILQGKIVYYNPIEKTVSTAKTGTIFAGYAWNTAGAGEAFVDVKISI